MSKLQALMGPQNSKLSKLFGGGQSLTPTQPTTQPTAQPAVQNTVAKPQPKQQTMVTNQPTTAGGYVVPNFTSSQPQTNYLQPSQPVQQTTGTFNRDVNQQIASKYGFTGQAGGGAVDAWLQQNPGQALNYATDRRQYEPNYNLSYLDFDPNTAGVQSYGRDINQSIGTKLGYNGNVGRGELGSGQVGVDFLSLLNDPQAINQYEQYRHIFEPNYSYAPKNVAPEGWDEQSYMQMNPDVADQVGQGKYITGLQQYLLEGKNQGRQYQDPYGDFLTQLQDSLGQYTNAPQTPDALDAGANFNPIARPANTDAPPALSYLNELSDAQKRSAIATDGVYGAGADKGSQDYYLQVLLNNMMDENGQIQNFDSALPVERQYLNMLGLNTNNGNDFLTSLQRAYGYGFV